MTRLGGLLFLACVTGCVGEVHASHPDECTMGASEACTQPNGNVGTHTCAVGESGYVWGACAPASCTGNELTCVTPDSRQGVAACNAGQSASACGVLQVGDGCEPGQTEAVSLGPEGECYEGCTLVAGTWQWDSSSCMTPLVLAFDRERVEFTRAPGEFDLAGREATVLTDWVSARTPWLAMDRDGNGRIDDGRELFGSMTELPGGDRASNGFAALAALDDDRDGRITARDSAFERLLLWRDTSQDRRSNPDELTSAAEAGLVAIRLDYDVVPRCDASGNCESERAVFVFRDASGREREGDVVDVHFAAR